MSHDHHNHGHSEKKSVAFGTPMILGAITVFIILCFVSLGNPSHGHSKCECKEDCSKECMEACEKGDHGKHPDAKGHEEGHATAAHEEHAAETVATETTAVADSTKAEPAKTEETHH